ncbi:hypothetical protein EJ08DRAFT_124126 [Tothia fuscella]|uniref:Uncharacterized protein n=1 Tax=Tothia fuscella TaxID=1048955 RepID=A0A9P4NWV1_9PEZI|nr:hypothetical protein EJ08DRAFT_124126 [Tothia fuscella]
MPRTPPYRRTHNNHITPSNTPCHISKTAKLIYRIMIVDHRQGMGRTVLRSVCLNHRRSRTDPLPLILLLTPAHPLPRPPSRFAIIHLLTLSAADQRPTVEETRSSRPLSREPSVPRASEARNHTSTTDSSTIDPNLRNYAVGARSGSGNGQRDQHLTNGESKAERKRRLEEQREAVRLQMEALNRDIALMDEGDE